MVGAAIVGGAVIGGVASNRAAGESADASRDAANVSAQSAREAQDIEQRGAATARSFFTPFNNAQVKGQAAAQILGDPQAQFDQLQNNPLFKLALDNANRDTEQRESSRRRLSFGDTLQQLSNNVLLSASPLIDRQREDARYLNNFGLNVATTRGNFETGHAGTLAGLQTDIGASQAAGIVGGSNAVNAGTAGTAQALQTGLLGASLFSDQPPDTSGRILAAQPPAPIQTPVGFR